MYPLTYTEPVFRPPSEWKSLILQITNGCSWNRCTFCEMYTQEQKKFNHKDIDQVISELRQIKASGIPVQRVFLADGDAMTLSTRRLKLVLQAIHDEFPQIQRISSYCLPRNLRHKTIEELKELQTLGLDLLYVGCESGDDEVLSIINKGESFDSSLDALEKIKAAAMRSSVMILNGLGGMNYSVQHAENSARLMNAAQPDYLSTLVISFPRGRHRFEQGFHSHQGEFIELDQHGLFAEMRLLLSQLELNRTIFRSDHASNYLVLKGILGRDKATMLAQIDQAIQSPHQAHLRPEYQRGL